MEFPHLDPFDWPGIAPHVDQLQVGALAEALRQAAPGVNGVVVHTGPAQKEVAWPTWVGR